MRHKIKKMIVRNVRRNCVYLVLTMMACAMTAFYFRFSYKVGIASVLSWVEEEDDFDLVNVSLLLNTPGCRIPNFDPLDPTTRHLTKTLPEASCPEAGALTYLRAGFVTVNASILSLFYNDSIAYCESQEIIRPSSAKNPDFEFQYNSPIRFNESLKIESEFVRVACFGANKTRRYVGFHAQAGKQPNVAKDSFKRKIDVNQPNVLLIGLDSTSRLNSMRQLVETRRYLLDELLTVELKGYNRVGLNTFPNIIPLLTGTYPNDFVMDFGSAHFDDLPLIWKRYDDRGYRTVFAEDGHTGLSIFNYLAKGFNRTPTDYYLRPLNLAIMSEYDVGYADSLCVGATPENRFVLNWLYDVISTPDPRPYFALAFFWRRLHEDMNELSRVDRMFAAFFRRLYDERRLDNTVLVVFGDHGIRWGPLKATRIGVIEENLPMCVIRLPPAFGAVHPAKVEALKRNAAARLTTPFDVHETLVHLLDLTDNGDEMKYVRGCANGSRRGLTLFESITSNRTCEDLGIAALFCGCQVDVVNTTSAQRDEVLKVAHLTVDFMNNETRVHRGLCANLTLGDVVESRIVINDSSHTARGIDHHILTFTTSPGAGKFNTMVHYFRADGKIEVLGDIERLNLYGNQSACIDDAVHRKWCFCHE